MNYRGHLRTAFVGLVDALFHLEAVKLPPEDVLAPHREFVQGVSAGRDHIRTGVGMLRRRLEELEPTWRESGPQDNGETPLEWARGALEAAQRFEHCLGGLNKSTGSDADAVAPALQALRMTRTGLVAVVEQLERLEGEPGGPF